MRENSPKESPKRILLIHRYFWPDTPAYASVLREIGAYWHQQGHEVHVFSTQPSYKFEVNNEKRKTREVVDGLQVWRCWLLPERSRKVWIRGLNSLLFVWQLFWHILIHGGRYDLAMCCTMPPIITGVVTSAGCRLRRCKFIYHTMDIWPEVAALTQQMNEGLVYRILRRMDTWACLRADAVVCLSSDMRDTYLKRSAQLKDKVHVIGNFELPVYDSVGSTPILSPLPKQPGKFRLLFAGNIGRYQGLEAVVQAAGKINNPRVEFVILGEGAQKESLIQAAKELGCLDRNLFFVAHQSTGIAKKMMQESDMCLVTLSPGVSSVAYPTKTLAALAAGCPIAAMVEPKSSLSQFVVKSQIGFAVDCGDSDELAEQIENLALDSQRLNQLKENALSAAETTAYTHAVLPKWDVLLEQIFVEPPKAGV